MTSRVLWCSARLALCLLSLVIFLGSFELFALGNGTPFFVAVANFTSC